MNRKRILIFILSHFVDFQRPCIPFILHLILRVSGHYKHANNNAMSQFFLVIQFFKEKLVCMTLLSEGILLSYDIFLLTRALFTAARFIYK